MHIRNFYAQALFLIAVLLAPVTGVNAFDIPVPNAGFEDRESFDPFLDGVDKYNQYARESWRHFESDNNGGPLRIWNPGVIGVVLPAGPSIADSGFGGNAAEGTYVVVVRSRYNDNEFHVPSQVRDFEAAVQILTNTFDHTLTYTLTAEVGRLPGSAAYSPNWYGYALQLVVGGTNSSGHGGLYRGWVEGGTVIAQDWNTVPVASNTFETVSVTYSPNPADAALVGQPIQIRLCALEQPGNHASTGWAAFDKVALEATRGLSISKTASEATTLRGNSLTYTLNVLNTHTTALGGIVVTDAIPAEVVFEFSNPPADFTNGNELVFNVGTLYPGSNTIITIDTTVVAAAPNVITNIASAITTNVLPFPSEAFGLAITPILAIEDVLWLTKTVSDATLHYGTNLTYAITITNISPDLAVGVSLTETFPTGLVFVSSQPPANQTNGNLYTYGLGDLPSGAATSILIEATLVYTGPVVFTNLASAIDTNGEINIANNSDTAVTIVPDTDGDGIANPFDPDDDNDGFPDTAELIAGTLAQDPTSYLWIRIEKTPDLQVRHLKFPSAAGRTYHLQGTTNLYTGPWLNVQTNLSGINGLMNIFRTNALEKIYYRVGVETP